MCRKGTYVCEFRTKDEGIRVGDIWRDEAGRAFIRVKKRGGGQCDDIDLNDIIMLLAKYSHIPA